MFLQFLWNCILVKLPKVVVRETFVYFQENPWILIRLDFFLTNLTLQMFYGNVIRKRLSKHVNVAASRVLTRRLPFRSVMGWAIVRDYACGARRCRRNYAPALERIRSIDAPLGLPTQRIRSLEKDDGRLTSEDNLQNEPKFNTLRNLAISRPSGSWNRTAMCGKPLKRIVHYRPLRSNRYITQDSLSNHENYLGIRLFTYNNNK